MPSAVPDSIQAPKPWLLLLEARAPWELGALLLSSRWLHSLPRGDGHTVLVFPGLGANDFSTIPLRQTLAAMGYAPQAWERGVNRGATQGVIDACAERARKAHERDGRKVSLVGWSLGGLFAREVAKLVPDSTRCVITLGTPFAGPRKANRAWRIYEWLSGEKVDAPEAVPRDLDRAPPVPTTSIYSRSDGIVAWRCSLNEEAPHTENIEVLASHFGLGLNPLTLLAIADRLKQDPARWRRFDRPAALRWLMRHGPPRPAA